MIDFMIKSQSDAWKHICQTLDELCPTWVKAKSGKNGMELAESKIREFHSRMIAAESERDELKSKLAEIESCYVDLTNNVSFADNGEAAYVADQQLMSRFDDLFDGAKPIPPQPIANNSESAKRIAEQEAREIILSHYNSFRFFDEWIKNEGRTLLAKLNEHREPVFTKQEFDRESARLGAIIESHIDDSAWLLKLFGVATEKDEHYKFRHIGCRIDREKVENKVTPNKADVPECWFHENDVAACLAHAGHVPCEFAPPTEKWKPIESAPKDRRIVLGRIGHEYTYIGTWDDHFKVWKVGMSDYYAQPTSWKSAPLPPLKDE